MEVTEEYYQRQPKRKPRLGACTNFLCGLCKNNRCQAPAEMDLLCSAQQYINECKQKVSGEKLLQSLGYLIGGKLTLQ